MSTQQRDRPGEVYDDNQNGYYNDHASPVDDAERQALEDAYNNSPSTSDLDALPIAEYPPGHPSRKDPQDEKSGSGALDGDGLKTAESAAGSGDPASAQSPSLPGESDRFGQNSNGGFYKSDTPKGRMAMRLALSGRRRGGIAGGVVSFFAFLIFITIPAGSLDMEHYQQNFIKNFNKAANQSIIRRRTQSIVYGLRYFDRGLKKDMALKNLERKGFVFEFEKGNTSKPKTVGFTDSSGKAGKLDLTAADMGAEVGRFLDDGGPKFAHEFNTSAVPLGQMLGEMHRGPAAERYFERFDIKRTIGWLSRAPTDPNETPAETLKNNLAAADEDLRAAEKPAVTGSDTFKDPGEKTDANGNRISGTDTATLDGAKAAQNDLVGNLTNGTVDSLTDVKTIGSATDAAFDGGTPSLAAATAALAEASPSTATKVGSKTALAGVDPLLVGQQACAVKGAIVNVNKVRRSAYALELIRFSFKWAAVGSARKEGSTTTKAQDLMELWMHRENPQTGKSFGTGGAIANAFGNKNVHADSTMLAQYSVGYASAGILAKIENFIKPFTPACKVANNIYVNVTVGVVGLAAAIFTGGTSAITSAAAQAVPIMMFVIAQDVVTQIATPILIRTGVHLALRGVEPGDMLEAAVTTGFSGGLNGINNAHVLAPTPKPLLTVLQLDAEEAQRYAVGKQSFKERYLSLSNRDSLANRLKVSAITAKTALLQGGVQSYASTVSATTSSKISSVLSPAAHAATQTDSLCQDPQALKYNIATDDFCNVINARSPSGLDVEETRRLLQANGDISLNGDPLSKDMQDFIKQCVSGQPGLLYKVDVKTDGTDDGETDLCVRTGNPLPGETKRLADAYRLDRLMLPKVAWWQKILGTPAYAATANNLSSGPIDRTERYLSWLGYLDDIADTNQTVTGDYSVTYDSNTSVVPTNTVGSSDCPASNSDPIDTKSPDLVPSPDGGTARVHKCIHDKVKAMFADAANSGIKLFIGNSWRSKDNQLSIRKERCDESELLSRNSCGNPPVGSIYTSMHLKGLAMDLRFVGQNSIYMSRNDAAFQWLAKNAGKYGFYNLPSEPWHWSVNGH